MIDTLVIQNFGPIKDIKISFKKYNFFIGNQGTGKSIIAKLYTLFNDLKFIFNPDIDQKFSQFNIAGFFHKNTFIEFNSENGNNSYNIQILGKSCKVQTSPAFDDILKGIKLSYENLKIPEGSAFRDIDFYTYMNLFFRTDLKAKTYIPSERNIISLISQSSFSFLKNDINLPFYITEFGEFFQSIRSKINKVSFDFLGIEYLYDKESGDLIRLIEGNKSIKLNSASSGIQSIIPLLIVLLGIKSSKTNRFLMDSQLVIEEPELNLSPDTQYKLVKLIISECKPEILMTTHSPYILASINNCIAAFQAGKKHPRKTANIVKNRMWIDPKDVAAYMLHKNGVIENIMDDEEGLIRVEKIDEVSSLINNEFNQLLNIELGIKG